MTIQASHYLFDSKSPLKYSIQNVFDGNPATSYVENTEDDLIKLSFPVYGNKYSGRFTISLINGYASNEKLYQKAYKVEVVDSTGAGDSFAGCFLACLSLGMEIRECLKYASLSGAYCCKGLGGMYSSVPLETLELFLKEQNGKK